MVAFHRGGNAVDAAIAANAAIAVTSPHLCGLGGDLFVLVHTGRSVRRRSTPAGDPGPAPTPPRSARAGHSEMPFRHDIRSVTVPGCVDGWISLHERFGSIPLADVLAPAIRVAEHGFPASPLLVAVAGDDRRRGPRQPPRDRRPGDARRGARTPVRSRPGRCAPSPPTAATASTAASSRPGCSTLGRGYFVAADLERSQADWVTPLTADAFGVRLHTIPPNSQGYLTLGAARLASQVGLPDDPDDPQWAHLLIEAATAAGFDRPEVLHERADGAALLAAIDARSSLIDPQRAGRRPCARPCRRHHLPLHGRRARDGRVAHPVERGRVRIVAGRAEHRASTSTTAASGSPSAPGTPPSTRPAADRRTRCRPRSRRVVAISPRCSARWAATPNHRSSCNSPPGCSTTDRARPPPCTPAGGRCTDRRAGSTRGPRRMVRRCPSRATPPTPGGPASPSAATWCRTVAAYDSGYGHAHAIVIEPSGMLVGAADPRVRSPRSPRSSKPLRSVCFRSNPRAV